MRQSAQVMSLANTAITVAVPAPVATKSGVPVKLLAPDVVGTTRARMNAQAQQETAGT
jgi:hypothetical protein